jgi:hypothetical protein
VVEWPTNQILLYQYGSLDPIDGGHLFLFVELPVSTIKIKKLRPLVAIPELPEPGAEEVACRFPKTFMIGNFPSRKRLYRHAFA